MKKEIEIVGAGPSGLVAAINLAIEMDYLNVQARLEEIDLIQRLPAYCGYMKEVPRSIPRFRKQRRLL